MVLLAGIKISKRLKFCIGVLILIILLYLAAKFIISKANDCREQFITELIIPYEDAIKILQKGIMNNESLIRIIQSKLATYSFNRLDAKNIEIINSEDIPKIIHFIWIGSKLPEKYIANINTYITNNPGYEIWIWHDDNTLLANTPGVGNTSFLINTSGVDKMSEANDTNLDTNLQNEFPYKMQNINQLQFVNDFGLDNMKNWAGKADIIRYEIIYNYGGMYIDVDSRSVKAFDDNFNNSFVCIDTSGTYNNIQNAQFGFNQKSPFLEFVIACLQDNIIHYFNQYGNLDDILSICGPPFFTTCFYWWMQEHIKYTITYPYPVKCINQAFTIHNNDFSYNYHTMDKNW